MKGSFTLPNIDYTTACSIDSAYYPMSSLCTPRKKMLPGECSVYRPCIIAPLSMIQFLLCVDAIGIVVATPCRCCHHHTFIVASCPGAG